MLALASEKREDPAHVHALVSTAKSNAKMPLAYSRERSVAEYMHVHVQLAREQGDFLLVGLHTDDDVMERRGSHLPIMDLHERSLSVLACRYVNEVIIGEQLPLMTTIAARAASICCPQQRGRHTGAHFKNQ